MKKEKYNWQRSKADIEKYWTELVSKNLGPKKAFLRKAKPVTCPPG